MEKDIKETEKDLIMVKLVTGEVVLGKLIEDVDGHITIGKPMTLMLDPMQGGVGMIPYDAVYTQEEPEDVSFRADLIVHDMKIHETFRDAYLKQTTGIEVPKKQEIIA